MLRVKKDDRVMVMVGKDKGKTGKVLRVTAGGKKVIVEKANMIRKTRRKTQQDQQGGFLDIEMPVHISNVMLIDRKTDKPTRIKISVLKDGTKVRVSKKSGEAIS